MVTPSSQPQTIGARAERIMYLASMTSNAKEIESYIRPLRALLVLRTRGDIVTPEEDAVLNRIENNIKRYILESEKLRSFTAETLEQHVYERVDAKRLIHRLQRNLGLVLAVALLIVITAYMLPFGAGDVRLRVSITTAITAGYVIGAYLFLTSRRKFSSAYESSFKLFSYAFIAGSLISSTNLVLTILYKGAVPWSNYWYVTAITYITFAVMYIGAHRLASLYSLKGMAMRIWWVASVAVSGSAILTVFPWAWELGVRSGVGSIGAFFALVFSAHGGWLMFRVWRLANPLYRAPTKALGLGLICISIAWVTIVISPLFPTHLREPASILSSILFIICSMLLIRSGYALSKLSRS